MICFYCVVYIYLIGEAENEELKLPTQEELQNIRASCLPTATHGDALKTNPLNKLILEFSEAAAEVYKTITPVFKDEAKGHFLFCGATHLYMNPNLLLITDYPPPANVTSVFNTDATVRLFSFLEKLGIRANLVDRLPITIKPAMYKQTLKESPDLYKNFTEVKVYLNNIASLFISS